MSRIDTRFEKCAACGEYGFFPGHRCHPLWKCTAMRWENGTLIQDCDDEDPVELHAFDAQGAAERFASRYDWDGSLAGDGHYLQVRVTSLLDPDKVTFWSVCCEMVPEYRPHEIRPIDD